MQKKNKYILSAQCYILLLCIVFNAIIRPDFTNNSSSTDENANTFIVGCWPYGFFSGFLAVLNSLSWATENDKTPVVYWDHTSLYHDVTKLETNNVWEYYFEPVSNASYQPGQPIYTRYKNPSGYGIPWEKKRPCFDQNLRIYFNKIITQYIKIKSHIQDKINTFYTQKIYSQKTIGIHLRGTDKVSEAKPVNPKTIFDQANQLADKIGKCQFFIATDEERLLILAQQNLNRPVIYYNSYRSKTSAPVHTGETQSNRYKLGEDVLIEAQLLSRCNYFLHTRSNVAIAVCMFNPNLINIFFEN